MVKHTITNNQCYVLVSIEWFYSLWQSYGKINGKISAENSNRKPLPIETMGRGFLVSDCVCGGYTHLQRLGFV